MKEQEKWNYIIELDEKLLLGGVILSEWTTFLAKDAETAFCAGANLSSILACQATIESHLRYDYFQNKEATNKWSFYQLIENSDFADDLKQRLQELRKFRNKWVHVKDPENDTELLERSEFHENQLFEFCKKSIEIMLKVLYTNTWI